MQFWTNVLSNFLANIAAGVILGVLGFIIGKKYKSKIIKFMQENIQGGSHNIQAGRDVILNTDKAKDSSAKDQPPPSLTTGSPISTESFGEKISKDRRSIVAIGFIPATNQMTIVGSGFCVSGDGKILTAAHIYNQTPPQFQSKLMGMVMTKQEQNGLEHYIWLPLDIIEGKKTDNDDVVLFQIQNFTNNTLLQPLVLGDSSRTEVGDEVYFMGFPYAANLINEGFGITLIVNRGMISNIKHDGIDPLYPRNWFVVDAISNPGNSGCPLIDRKTNEVVGIMSIAFRTKSQVPKYNDLDIREPMHIAGAKPINLAKKLL